LHADRLDARTRAAAGDAEAALDLLERAASGFARLAAAWEVAVTELALGEVLVTLDRNDDAARVLGHAAAEFERLRVPRELGEARALLERLASVR
jgi:hypothetical protein